VSILLLSMTLGNGEKENLLLWIKVCSQFSLPSLFPRTISSLKNFSYFISVYFINFIYFAAPAEQNQQVFRSLLALDCLCRALGVLMRESQSLSRIPVNVLSEWTTEAGTKACLSLGQLQRCAVVCVISFYFFLLTVVILGR
jgi:hypothetical protein